MAKQLTKKKKRTRGAFGRRRKIQIETLEDRILYNGAPIEAFVDPDASAYEESVVQVLTEDQEADDTPLPDDDAAEALSGDTESDDETVDTGVVDSSQDQQLRTELLFVDGNIANSPNDEYAGLAADLLASAPDSVRIEGFSLDADRDGFAQIAEFLAQYTLDGQRIDAIHIVSHSRPGTVHLGTADLTLASLSENADLAESIAAWGAYLAVDADILFYGCDLASTDEGVQLVEQIASLTGADVAASDNVTGAEVRGGDWILEINTGTIETQTLFSTLDLVLPAGAQPQVTLDAPADVRIGESPVTVTVTFNNATSDNTTGFGPWIDVIFDRTGADGIFDPANPETGDGAGVYDGYTLIGDPQYLGIPLNFIEITLDDTANGGLGVLHPYALDALGQPVYLNATIANDPSHPDYDASSPYNALLAGFQSGDALLVIELPFGSFTPDQPAAEVTFQLAVSELADLDVPLEIRAQGGFRFGEDPLDNPLADPVIVGGAVGVSSTPVNTTLADLSKSFDGPEGETATGPNFQRTYTLNLDIAEGQTLTNVNLFDALPDEIQYIGIGSVTVGGAPLAVGQYIVIEEPDTSITGGRLHIEILGNVDGDVQVEIEFYVPRQYDVRDANGVLTGTREDVLPEDVGTFLPIHNQTYGFGSWVPVDGRDDPVIIGFNVDGNFDGTDLATALATAAPDGNFENTFSAQSIAIQKGVSILDDNNYPGATPEDILQYTLNFQVSDYFAFDQVIITDVLSDGQEFLQNATYYPTLTIFGNGFSLALDFDPAHYTVDFFAPVTGETTIVFDVSAQLIAYASSLTQPEIDALDSDVYAQMLSGMLLGGGVNPGSPDDFIDNDLLGGTPYDNGGTIGQIIFQTLILNEFQENFPSGEPHLNPRDTLTNSVVIEGRVLELQNALAPSVHSQSDGSGTSISIVAEEVQKEIFAINGVLRLTDPADLSSAENPVFTASFRNPEGAILLQPGDEVTYRLSYVIPTGDVEELRFTDFFPLPVFDVTDPNGDGTPSAYTFINNWADVSVYSLDAGDITYGPAHNAHDVTGPGAFAPTLIVDPISNSLRLEWGDFTSEANIPRLVDVLVTMTVSNDPFADGLFLTNQVQSGEQNTQNPGVENEATTNAIIQIQLGQPVVNIYKGVVASTQNGSVGEVGGLTFDGIGLGGDGFSGTLVGQGNAEAIGELNLIAGSLPDAGDTVRYALVLQNTGRSDAFDVRFQDSVLSSYARDFADTSTFASETNFRVFRGDGTLLALGTDYTLVWNNATNTFAVELVDNYSGGNVDGDDKLGALSRGFNANIGEDVENGSNSVIVLYDLELVTSVEASSTLTNTAVLLNYANDNDQPNHLDSPFPGDDADVLIASPAISKVLIGTELDEPGNNDTNQAVIGEEAYYRITITVPEGTTAGAVLRDTLPDGMAFKEITAVNYSAGVTSTTTPGTGANPGNVVIGADGHSFSINFGDITNTNTDNSVVETIEIEFTAVVLNVAGNQGGTTLRNDVDLDYVWADDPSGEAGTDTISDSAALVTVVEPVLVVENTMSYDNIDYVNDLSVDAGDVIYYRVVIENNGDVNAHNVSIYDRLPTVFDIAETSIISVTGALDTTHFELVTDNKFGDDKPALRTTEAGTLQTLAPEESVTIVIQTTIVDNIVTASTHPNGVEVRWTSLPNGIRSDYTGDDIDGMPGALPGNGTPVERSVHNSNAVQRTGADGVDGDLNDYAAGDSTTLRAYAVNSFLKTLEGTELIQPGNNGPDEAVIGEIVTYSIRFRVPEGVTNNLVIEDVLDAGLGFVEFTGLSIAAGVSTSTGLDSTSAAAALNAQIGTHIQYDHAPAADENTLTINLGTITNANITNNSPAPPAAPGDEIVITYRAVVLNTQGNQQGTDLNNTATASYETVVGIDENSDEEVVDAAELTDSSDNVTVIEPVVEVLKDVTAAIDPTDPLSAPDGNWAQTLEDVDAGDRVYYRIQINASVTTAFDLSLLDNLPVPFDTPELHEVSSSGTISFDGDERPAALGDFDITGADLTNSANIDMQAGSSITIIVRGILSDSVGADNLIENTVDVTWTSLDGDISDLSGHIGDGTDAERTGDGVGPNNYADDNDADIRITPLEVKKELFRTSEAHTSGSDVVIGEIVQYRLITRVPEGTMQNMQIRDFLPDGMTFMNDGTARLAFVSDEGMTSSVAAINDGVGLNIVGFSSNVLPTFLIPASQIEIDGNEVRFNLGTVTNTNDNDANDEFVVITFNALVTNVGTNNAGTELDNSFEARVDNGTNETSDIVTIEVVEPQLTVEKAVAVEPNDAGDDFEYTITIANNSGVDAFNVTLEDELHPFFNFYDRNADSIIDLSDALEIISGPGGITLANFEITDFDEGGADNILQTTGNGFTLENGQTLVLRLYGRLSQSVPPSAEINNQVDIAWTSLPDDGTPVGLANRTGSVTPGDSGDEDGERNGADGVDGALNDYAASSAVVTTTVSEIAVAKYYFGSSEAHTSDADREVTIGETVTYAIMVTLPESTLGGLQVTDIVPTGMQYVTGSASLVQTVAASADWDGNELLTTDFDGILEDVDAGNFFTVTGGAGDGNDVVFSFGEIVVNATPTTTANSFIITLDLLVLNVASNQSGTDLENRAQGLMQDAHEGNDVGDAVTSDPVEVTVVEPNIVVQKVVHDAPANPDAGDIITYRVTLENTGTATAFNANFLDTLDDGLTYVGGSLLHMAGVDITASLNMAGGGTTLSTLAGGFSLAAGASTTFEYRVVIPNTVVDNQDLDNSALLTWTSLPDDGTAPPPGASGEEDGQRDGSGFDDLSDPNNYRDSDDAQVTANLLYAVEKVVHATSAAHTIGNALAIGEEVTFRITATLGEGTTNNLVLTDTLPFTNLVGNNLGVLEFVSAAFVSSGANVSGPNVGTPTITNSGLNNEIVTFAFGNVVVAGIDGAAPAADRQIVVEVVARAANVIANESDDVLTNTVVLTSTEGDTVDDDVPVTIVEPVLTLTKTTVTAGLDGADTVEYDLLITNTGNAAAFDILILDILDGSLRLVPGSEGSSLEILGGPHPYASLDQTGNAVDLVSTVLNRLNAGDSVTVRITAQVRPDAVAGSTIENTASITYTSLPGVDPNQRTGDGDPTDPDDPDTYTDEDDSDSFRLIQPTIAKSLFDTSEASTTGADLAIGEVATFAFLVTLPEGTTQDVVITDFVPGGMVYTGYSIITDAASSGGLLIADYAGTVPVPAVTGGAVNGEDVVFTFGDIVTTANNDADTNSFVLLVDLRLLNVLGNQDGDTHENGGELTYIDGTDGPSTVDAGTVTTNVVEPELQISKTNDDADGFVAAGQTIVYTIEVEHTADSTANAYDLILNDLFPAELEDIALVSAVITDGVTAIDVSGAFSVVGNQLSTIGKLDLLRDTGGLGEHQQLVLQVSARVIVPTPGGTDVDNEAEVLWSSLDGGLQGDDPGDDTERTGVGDPMDPDDPNDYVVLDNSLVTVGLGSIGDRVWWDINADGIQDPFEIGLPGLVVNLWRDDTGDGVLDTDNDFFITSTITDADGFYLFENLPTENDDGAGGVTQIQYIVEVVPTPGLIATYDLDGLGTLHTAALTLDDGNENRRDVDFGYRGSSSVGHTIWNDVNRDGVQQPNEAGVPGIGVELVFSGGALFGGNTVTLTTTTDANGQYLFENLIGGSYTVTLDPDTIPAGFTFTYDLDGALDGTTSFVLGDQQNRRDVDFGIAAPLPPPVALPPDVPDLQYDLFSRFLEPFDSLFSSPGSLIDDSGRLLIRPVDTYRDAILPIAPIYSGYAEPGSTLVVVLYNSMGQEIGRQTVVADTGGNWLATLPGVVVKDYPQSVVIMQTPASGEAGGRGYNLRPFYASAIQPGHFFSESRRIDQVADDTSDQVLEDYLQLFNSPIGLGKQMHAYEAMAMPGHPTGR